MSYYTFKNVTVAKCPLHTLNGFCPSQKNPKISPTKLKMGKKGRIQKRPDIEGERNSMMEKKGKKRGPDSLRIRTLRISTNPFM